MKHFFAVQSGLEHKGAFPVVLSSEAERELSEKQAEITALKAELATKDAEIAKLRDALASAGISILSYDASYGTGNGEEEAFEIAKLLGYEGNLDRDDIDEFMRTEVKGRDETETGQNTA